MYGVVESENERHRCGRMLFANVDEELTLQIGEVVRAAAVASWLGTKRVEPALSISVIPTLERRYREGLGLVGARRAKTFLAELAETFSELAVREIFARQRADDLASKERDLLGMVFGHKGGVGHGCPFCAGLFWFLRREKTHA